MYRKVFAPRLFCRKNELNFIQRCFCASSGPNLSFSNSVAPSENEPSLNTLKTIVCDLTSLVKQKKYVDTVTMFQENVSLLSNMKRENAYEIKTIFSCAIGACFSLKQYKAVLELNNVLRKIHAAGMSDQHSFHFSMNILQDVLKANLMLQDYENCLSEFELFLQKQTEKMKLNPKWRKNRELKTQRIYEAALTACSRTRNKELANKIFNIIQISSTRARNSLYLPQKVDFNVRVYFAIILANLPMTDPRKSRRSYDIYMSSKENSCMKESDQLYVYGLVMDMLDHFAAHKEGLVSNRIVLCSILELLRPVFKGKLNNEALNILRKVHSLTHSHFTINGVEILSTFDYELILLTLLENKDFDDSYCFLQEILNGINGRLGIDSENLKGENSKLQKAKIGLSKLVLRKTVKLGSKAHLVKMMKLLESNELSGSHQEMDQIFSMYLIDYSDVDESEEFQCLKSVDELLNLFESHPHVYQWNRYSICELLKKTIDYNNTNAYSKVLDYATAHGIGLKFAAMEALMSYFYRNSRYEDAIMLFRVAVENPHYSVNPSHFEMCMGAAYKLENFEEMTSIHQLYLKYKPSVQQKLQKYENHVFPAALLSHLAIAYKKLGKAENLEDIQDFLYQQQLTAHKRRKESTP